MKAGVVAVLVLAFLAAGIIGHDPWKPDEAYTFGLVMHILEHGDWLVPHLAGEPFLEKPPLYFWTAALCARLLSPVLALHDGARVASFLYMALGFGAIAATARRLFGAGGASRSALLAVGTLGLLVHAHEMITDTALFAGLAVAMAGLAAARGRPLAAGAVLGTGVGIGFMAKGLLAPGIVGVAVALLLVDRDYRERRFAAGCAWALAFALPWLLAWPAVLFVRDPAAFDTWFWINNVGRFMGYAHLGATSEPLFYTTTLPWFTLPAGALAAWTTWRAWRGAEEDSLRPLLAPLAMVLSMLLLLGASATARALYALPMIAPLAVLGAPSVPRLPDRIGMAAACAVTVLSLTLVILAWVLYGADLAGFALGRPAMIAKWLPTEFKLSWHPLAVAFAALVTLGWVALWVSMRTHWLTLWAAAIAAPWCVWMSLMLPWIDHAKSFRAPFGEVAGILQGAPCVQSHGLGEPQRAMLDYVAGITTQRLEKAPSDCPYVILQSDSRGRLPRPSPEWRVQWEGARPGERSERFQVWQSVREAIARERLRPGPVIDRKRRRA